MNLSYSEIIDFNNFINRLNNYKSIYLLINQEEILLIYNI